MIDAIDIPPFFPRSSHSLVERAVASERGKLQISLEASVEIGRLKATNAELVKMLTWFLADYQRVEPSDALDYMPSLRDLQEAADARGEDGPIDRVRAALAKAQDKTP